MLEIKPKLPSSVAVSGGGDESKKTSLKEFLSSKQGAAALQGTGLALTSSLHTTIAGIAGTASIFGSKETEERFAQGVTDIVQSEDFTDELSRVIGKPLPTETEDAFVARAKAKMTILLKKKLSK
ncbi:hypothetical protein [Paraburkholderia kirstenboschensis]|uniref:Uncharacterized protein n=1 Tax=Paraburkholderia kirstenboschensis TaxID=1245436 RepID=A0ABZ0ED61_9BURK|nr:hypothetical protein [Paraburkholderia kirstenboschensis]WOD14450.1 hypothetical protein RW095_02970 [Paraburkholderia kirstenboschensis]